MRNLWKRKIRLICTSIGFRVQPLRLSWVFVWCRNDCIRVSKYNYYDNRKNDDRDFQWRRTITTNLYFLCENLCDKNKRGRWEILWRENNSIHLIWAAISLGNYFWRRENISFTCKQIEVRQCFWISSPWHRRRKLNFIKYVHLQIQYTKAFSLNLSNSASWVSWQKDSLVMSLACVCHPLPHPLVFDVCVRGSKWFKSLWSLLLGVCFHTPRQ